MYIKIEKSYKIVKKKKKKSQFYCSFLCIWSVKSSPGEHKKIIVTLNIWITVNLKMSLHADNV